MNYKLPVLILSFLLAISSPLFAQKQYTVSGTLKDSSNGESLIGAVVFVKGNVQSGISTNSYGFFSIKVPQGAQTLTIQMLGYDTKEIALDMAKDSTISIRLSQSNVALTQVTVNAEKNNQNVTNVQMSVEKLDIKEIADIPVFLGEKDVLKTLQLLPGVKSAGDGNSGFYVRGGAADQNLILLDEAPVYNASHLLGFFSVFNSDAIKDVTLYKGGMPAEFGGRIASVLDVRMNDGNDQRFSVSGGIGLITSRLTLEGPFKKNKGSFIVSGRLMYGPLLAKIVPKFRSTSLYFYDFNLKANYELTKKDKLFISGYFGRDYLGLNNVFGLNYGNITATLRWNHIFSDKLFCNTSLIFSRYNYVVTVGNDSTQANIQSQIQDIHLKEDFQYYANGTNTLKFGLDLIYHTFVPGRIDVSNTGTGTPLVNNLVIPDNHALETAIYASDEQVVTTWLKLQYGIRISMFTALGPQTTYSYDASGDVTDSTTYRSGKVIVNYINPEPRFAANFIINDRNSIKLSYDRNSQYLHQLSNSTSSNPTDIWIPSSKIVRPEIGDQVAVGWFGNFLNGSIKPSVETYYKWMQNQIDYENGADILLNKLVESQLIFGKGWSYGVEFLTRYSFGKLSGWVAYDWSRSLRSFPDVNNGAQYYAPQDRTHEVSLVSIYKINKKWTISAVWVFYTGNAVTFPEGRYEVLGLQVPNYTERNAGRMPNYHRLDLGATMQLKKTKHNLDQNLNFALYNAYGRENAYSIAFQQNPNDPSQTQAVQTSLFRWVPSITYNFKF